MIFLGWPPTVSELWPWAQLGTRDGRPPDGGGRGPSLVSRDLLFPALHRTVSVTLRLRSNVTRPLSPAGGLGHQCKWGAGFRSPRRLPRGLGVVLP
jgi:hypothetical protein